jgi:hypothetical protein
LPDLLPRNLLAAAVPGDEQDRPLPLLEPCPRDVVKHEALDDRQLKDEAVLVVQLQLRHLRSDRAAHEDHRAHESWMNLDAFV